jgi:hypothetical protein
MLVLVGCGEIPFVPGETKTPSNRPMLVRKKSIILMENSSNNVFSPQAKTVESFAKSRYLSSTFTHGQPNFFFLW